MVILFGVEYQKLDEGIVGILFNFYFPKSSQRIYLSVYIFLQDAESYVYTHSIFKINYREHFDLYIDS